MSRVVPSQIVGYLSTMFTSCSEEHLNEVYIQRKIGAVAGFLDLYDRLPDELIRLGDGDYADLVASVATIRFATSKYQMDNKIESLQPLRGAHGALSTAWQLIEHLCDSVPSTSHDLAFITDNDLRRMIGTDISAVSTNLQSGEWKSATIIVGSCCEALLLYALQATEQTTGGSIVSAVRAITWNGGQSPNPNNPIHPSWNLFCYCKVAEQLNLITSGTKSEVDRLRDYRNLIHPAKMVREQTPFDRGTAYISVGALEHVIRDLRKNL